MPTCVFRTAEVRRCITHALHSPRWKMGYTGEEPAVPALFFVHDDGVYLMSNGDPADLKSPGELSCYAAYAEGCDPDKDAEYYETARYLVGGDDFAETLPITKDWLRSCDEFEELHVVLTADQLATVFRKPYPKPAPRPLETSRGRA